MIIPREQRTKRSQASSTRPRVALASWTILTLALGLLLASSGCKKKTAEATSSLLQYVPRDNHGVFMVNRLQDVPQQLDALLLKYEGPQGQFRTFASGVKGRIGLDPLSLKDLKSTGMDPSGAMVLTRLKFNKRKHGLMVVAIASQSGFEAWLQDNLKTRLVAKTFVPTKTEAGKIVTAYRVKGKGQTQELVAYSLRKNAALVAWSFDRSEGKTTQNAALLQALLKQDAKSSMQTDKAFHKALNDVGKSTQAMVYVPPTSEKVDAKTAKVRAAMLQKRLNAFKKRFPMLGRLPAGQLQALLKSNPLDGVISTVSFGAKGLNIKGMVPIPKMVMAPVRSAIPSGGSAQNLLKALHRDAILTIKTGVEPAMVPTFIDQAIKGMKRDPKKLHELLKKHTGLEIKKDIVPAATGHVMMALYRVNMKPLSEVINGNPLAVLKMLDLAIVAEAKDPKLMHATLKLLASKFNNGPFRVKTTKGQSGRETYSVTAWPGVVARWTSYKNYLIYAFNEASIRRTIDAIDNPKLRAYPDPSKAGIMAANDSSALSLDLSNLRTLLGELPFMYRLVVSNAIANYNLDKLRALTLSYQPGQDHAILQAGLKFK